MLVLMGFFNYRKTKICIFSLNNEKNVLYPQMQTLCQKENAQIEFTPLNMYNKFIERIRRHLHVVLAFSPIGDAFRNRLRMFPSLINCCTIDWFKVCYSSIRPRTQYVPLNSMENRSHSSCQLCPCPDEAMEHHLL